MHRVDDNDNGVIWIDTAQMPSLYIKKAASYTQQGTDHSDEDEDGQDADEPLAQFLSTPSSKALEGERPNASHTNARKRIKMD